MKLHLPHGDTLTFRYAVVVTDGDHGDDGTAALAGHGRAALAERPPGVVSTAAPAPDATAVPR